MSSWQLRAAGGLLGAEHPVVDPSASAGAMVLMFLRISYLWAVYEQ